MLSTLLATKTWANTPHAARRVAAQIASAFVPKAHLAPLTREALCYGCMAGIVMTIHATCEAGPPQRSIDGVFGMSVPSIGMMSTLDTNATHAMTVSDSVA
ncbi:protein of unknown function [Burkholderia multivorans]